MATSETEEPEEEDFVTREEVHGQINLLEQVKDLVGTDDDWLAGVLANQVQMARMERVENELLREIRDQSDNIIGEFPFEMSHDVPPDTPVSSPNEVVRVPDEQNVTRVVAVSLGWPDGASNAVGIQITTGSGLTLFPRNPEDNFVAFNDFSETFGLRYELNPGEELIARTINVDATNSHFVNIVPHIEEVPTEEDEN